MKAKEVLKLLRISRPTLTKYVKSGLIKTITLPNGLYDYDKDSVYNFLSKDCVRYNYLYARVSTQKQKKDLENQIELLKQYCFNNGIQVNGIYSDIASGISFDKRKDFFKLIDEVTSNKVNNVIITYKDRLSRVGFELFKYWFDKHNTNIVVISEIGNAKLDSQEVFEEIVSLLHCYSMKLYSSRKIKKVKELIAEDE